eukprot:753975-Hanusia_phi.AAC.6
MARAGGSGGGRKGASRGRGACGRGCGDVVDVDRMSCDVGNRKLSGTVLYLRVCWALQAKPKVDEVEPRLAERESWIITRKPSRMKCHTSLRFQLFHSQCLRRLCVKL